MKALRNFWENVYKKDKEEKKKQRRNLAFFTWKMPKLSCNLAQIVEQSTGTTRGKFVVFLFCSKLIVKDE